MAIHYFIDLGCKPREEIGTEELLALIARWQQAQTIRAQFVERYGLADEEKMRYKRKHTTLSGEASTEEVTVAGVRRDCASLWAHEKHCEKCPAALTEHPYSCINSIAFPISAQGEQWLVDQLAPAGSRVLGHFLEAAGSEDSRHVATFSNWRRAGFLEAKEPPKADRAGLSVRSDAILRELLLVGDLQPPHALGVLLHLQAMETTDGRRGDELLALIEQVNEDGDASDAPEIDFCIRPEAEDDASTTELKQFLFALFRAFSLQVPLAVRL